MEGHDGWESRRRKARIRYDSTGYDDRRAEEVRG